MSRRIRLEFCFDVVSPYSALAFSTLTKYAKSPAWMDAVSVELKPVFLGGIMQLSENQPPGLTACKNKARWMRADLRRASTFSPWPLKWPSTFPANTISTQRFLLAAQSSGAADSVMMDVVGELFQRYWGLDMDVTDAESLVEAATKVGVSKSDAETWCAMTATPQIKDALKAATQDAVDRGAFGAPTMFITDTTRPDAKPEMFFGSDRFEQICLLYGLDYEGPLGPSPSSKL